MALNTAEIENTFEWLINQYELHQNKETTALNILSKSSVMELSGWIEDEVDNIALRYVDKLGFIPNEKKAFKEGRLKRVESYKFQQIKDLIQDMIGLKDYRKFSDIMSQIEIIKLETALNTLNNVRNVIAHTTVGIQVSLYAPSYNFQRYKDIREGLELIEQQLSNFVTTNT